MNIVVASNYDDEATILTAKTCGSACKNAKVVYFFAEDTNQCFFLDKKDITKNQLGMSETLAIGIRNRKRIS